MKIIDDILIRTRELNILGKHFLLMHIFYYIYIIYFLLNQKLEKINFFTNNIGSYEETNKRN